MIHYHGTPMGGQRHEAARSLRGRHALVPFDRPDDLPLVMEVCQSFIADNSAFTKWRKGEKLDAPGYIDWCYGFHRHPGFDWALIPDVIDGSEDENDLLLSAWPDDIRGVPVFHLHESIERLVRLCSRFLTVALGSSGEWATPNTESWWRRIAELMEAICDEHGRPPCRLHGLRMLNPDVFRRLPLSSADSTNAAQNSGSLARYGIYLPPTAAGRAIVIADRIEAHNSAPAWIPAAQEEFSLV